MTKLISNSISDADIKALTIWLKTRPQLTKGKLTIQFEKEWSKYIGCRYSVFVNSGSSANLLMVYACMLGKRLSGYKAIIPAVSWATTVSPFMQFGFNIILCDVKEDLTIDLSRFNNREIKDLQGITMIIHPLGIPCNMDEIEIFNQKTGNILLVDSCESVGSKYKGKQAGNYGLMSSYSFYYAHHLTTIEGGMVCTNDKEMYNLLLMLRSHGWDRDLSKQTQRELRQKNNINTFRARFTMYEPAFNVRATDLQAFLGLRQIKKLPEITKRRYENYLTYDKYLNNEYWKLKVKGKFSNFAYPVIHPKIEMIHRKLVVEHIEHRPLICGNIARQPFYRKYNTNYNIYPMADKIHDYGMYLPNNQDLKESEIKRICKIINGVIEKTK